MIEETRLISLNNSTGPEMMRSPVFHLSIDVYPIATLTPRFKVLACPVSVLCFIA